MRAGGAIAASANHTSRSLHIINEGLKKKKRKLSVLVFGHTRKQKNEKKKKKKNGKATQKGKQWQALNLCAVFFVARARLPTAGADSSFGSSLSITSSPPPLSLSLSLSLSLCLGEPWPKVKTKINNGRILSQVIVS